MLQVDWNALADPQGVEEIVQEFIEIDTIVVPRR